MAGTTTSRSAFRARIQPVRRRIVRVVALLAVVLAPLVAIPAGQAHALTSCAPSVRTSVWDGGAATSNWDDAANWNPDGVPTSADHVCIDTGTGVTVAVRDRAEHREPEAPHDQRNA